ncbi:hypothetical protein Ddc_16401 [Ditylenchus destructor]|nr:hypothetical protein Ddc_16401 [Ditylenchus destructor]
MFDEELSPEDYNEWVVRNHYSKQIPPAAGKQSTVNVRKVYRFRAEVDCKDSDFKITVFSAQTKLNDENWPLFQHFVRLLTDPFIYIRHMELTPQKDLLNLLTGAINQDRGRLQCGELKYNFDGKNKKFLNWTKTHVRCNEIKIYLYTSSNFNKLFFDLFMTGAHFSPNFVILGHLFNGVAAFVQKFIGLKNCDTSLMVDSIRCRVPEFTADAFKSNYEKFFIKEEKNQYDSTTAHVFEFVNADIGKKLQLTSTGPMLHELYPQVILEIITL